jgi:hypothetical protein
MSNIITKAELEKMLNLLNTEVLEHINDKIIYDPPYGWGIKPLLKYASEALAQYAVAVMRFAVEPLEQKILSEEEAEEYCVQWLLPYKPARDALSEASEDLKARLRKIAETPVLEPPFVHEYHNEYTNTLDYLDGEHGDLYPQFSDFLYSTLSPLRRRDITDQRILDLTQEADDLLAPHNKALERFIGKELNRLRSLVKDRLRYENLKDEEINYLKANKHRIPEAEWQSLSQALGSGTLTAPELKIFKKTLEEVKKPVPLPAPPKPLMPADDYIDFFLGELELAYGRFNDKRTEFYSDPLKSTLDDVFAGLYAVELAKAQNSDLSTLASIEAQQKKAEQFYLDFSNLKPLLNACIQIDLNSLSVDEVFTTETQAHKVIQAMLAFTAKHKAYFKRRYMLFNFNELAEELHHLLHEHTKGFTEALPSPSIEPLTAEAIASTPKAPRLTDNILPYFDLTIPIAKVLSEISADTVTTSTEVLLEVPNANSLVPVQDGMIKRLSHYLLGSEQAVPYLLDGDLIVHDTTADQYIKILPTIREDGYADYIFYAYGYKTLLRRIIKLQKLLNEKGYPTYDPRGGQKAHLKAVERLTEWDKTLVTQANELSAYEGYEHIQAELRKILAIHYYRTIYISAHKLAAYTFYPAEYTTFISAKPTDPATGEPLIYHVNHKNLCRSDNTPENLEIITKQLNDELRSTSRPVIYQGAKYNTLKSYCEDTGAGNYKNLQQAMNNLESTDPVTYNGRVYTLDPDTGIITVTDGSQAPAITFNGVTYATLKDFATTQGLSPAALRQALSRARKDNKTNFKYKFYNFYLEELGNIKITK